MKKLLLVLLLVLVASLAGAQEVVIEVGENMYVDAFGWQPYQPAFNLMPWAGGAFTITGVITLVRAETRVARTAGWIQILVGAGLFFGGLLLQGH